MREVEFRGKVLEDDEFWGVKKNQWLYGNLCIDKLEQSVDIEDTSKDDILRVNVDPNTIGQYTGLEDKNGTKIFEGDIVKYINTQRCIYEIGKKMLGVVVYDNVSLQYFSKNNFQHDNNFMFGKGLEVIGNIYDNPELLNKKSIPK